jgi:hypothetical protein
MTLPSHYANGLPTYFDMPIPNHPATARLREARMKVQGFLEAGGDEALCREMLDYYDHQIGLFSDGEASARQLYWMESRP